MNKNISIILIVIIIILIVSLISINEQKVQLKSDNIKLKAELVDLQNLIDINTLKADFSTLKALLNNYILGQYEDLFKHLKYIDINTNKGLIQNIYGEKSGIIILALEDLNGNFQEFYSELNEYNQELENAKNELSIIEEKYNEYNIGDFRQYEFIIKRRFDTDYITGRGIYEAFNMDTYKTVALMAYEDDIASRFSESLNLCVRDLGEREITVTNSNAFRTWYTTEFCTYYDVIPNEANPFKIKENIDYIKNTISNIESNLIEKENKHRKKLETEIINCKENIVNEL